MSKLTTHHVPAYNIKKIEENYYVLEMNLAGYREREVEVEELDGVLTIKSNLPAETPEPYTYLSRGFVKQNFVRQFSLGKSAVVSDVYMIDGILMVFFSHSAPSIKPIHHKINKNR
jgi:HSP20 family molecular chaperone IbpA